MTETQHRRWEPFAWVLLAVLVSIGIYGGVGTYYNGRADARRNSALIAENSANAVTNCENANQSREANRAMWGFVLDALSAGPKPSPAEVAFLTAFREYVGKVYAAHDCGQLDKAYPLPPPPTIPAAP